MPCVEENGLLPGRGAPGFGTGRGGAGALELLLATVSSEANTCSAARAAAAGISRRGGGASTKGARGVAGGADTSTLDGVASMSEVDGASAVTTLSLAGAFFAAFLAALAAAAAFHSSPRSLVRRATTGGSMVEDADLTNSPISLSAARTSLLGTSNSFASSWTLALATILLLGGPPREGRTVSRRACSSHESHRDVMSSCSTLFVGQSAVAARTGASGEVR